MTLAQVRGSVAFDDVHFSYERGREVMELLVQLNVRLGITVVMVTHDSNMAAYARRVINFIDGHLRGDWRNTSRESGPVEQDATGFD